MFLCRKMFGGGKFLKWFSQKPLQIEMGVIPLFRQIDRFKFAEESVFMLEFQYSPNCGIFMWDLENFQNIISTQSRKDFR